MNLYFEQHALRLTPLTPFKQAQPLRGPNSEKAQQPDTPLFQHSGGASHPPFEDEDDDEYENEDTTSVWPRQIYRPRGGFPTQEYRLRLKRLPSAPRELAWHLPFKSSTRLVALAALAL